MSNIRYNILAIGRYGRTVQEDKSRKRRTNNEAFVKAAIEESKRGRWIHA